MCPHWLRGACAAGSLALFGLLSVPGVALAHPPAPGAAPEQGEPEQGEPEDDAADDRRLIRVPTQADGMTASARTIDAETIATVPKRSAEDLLRLVPGLLIVQHGSQGKGYQFYLRGFDAVHGQDIETSLDGVPLNEPSNVHAHGYLDLAFIIPEVVQRVDATKGSFRVEQGDFATAGTIRYELGVPGPLRGTRVGYEVDTTDRHRAVVIHAPRRRPDTTFVAIEALHDRGYGLNRQAQRVSALGRARFVGRRGVELDGFTGVYAARFGLPGTVRIDDVRSGRVGFFDAYTRDTAGMSTRALGGMKLRLHREQSELTVTLWAMGRQLDLDENFTGDLQFPGPGDRHDQRQDGGSVGARWQYTRALGDRVQLRMVGSWRGDAIDERQDQLTADGETVWDTSRDLSILQQAFGVGIGLRVRPARWALIDAGVRFDAFDYHVTDRLQAGHDFAGTLVQPSPRIMLRFEPALRWQLFGAYGRGLRSPEARAFTLPATAPADTSLEQFRGGEPRITETDNAEAGARFRANELFDAGVSLFAIWIARESLFDHVSGFNIEQNATRRLGIEADMQIHATRWLDLGLDFTAVRARFVDDRRPIPGAPPILASMFGSLYHPDGWRAGLRWFLLGARPLAHGARAGALTVLDLTVGYRFHLWQIDLAVDNVLGLRWREGEYNYASHWDPGDSPSQIPTIHYIAGYPPAARATLTAWF